MARLFGHVVEPPRACSYLENERAELEYYLLGGVSPAEMEHLLAHGYRRFGNDYFRPACKACAACEPTRIVCDAFAPSRTQKRIAKKGARLEARWAEPSIDEARMDLYRRWHRSREGARDWEPSSLDMSTYRGQFMEPHACARELSFWDGDRVVAVSLVDETPAAFSAIYCYYEPDMHAYSLGTLNVLTLVARAVSQGKKHVYLGFKVQACPSLAYKGNFHLQETLVGRPGLREPALWAPVVSQDE